MVGYTGIAKRCIITIVSFSIIYKDDLHDCIQKKIPQSAHKSVHHGTINNKQ